MLRAIAGGYLAWTLSARVWTSYHVRRVVGSQAEIADEMGKYVDPEYRVGNGMKVDKKNVEAYRNLITITSFLHYPRYCQRIGWWGDMEFSFERFLTLHLEENCDVRFKNTENIHDKKLYASGLSRRMMEHYQSYPHLFKLLGGDVTASPNP